MGCDLAIRIGDKTYFIDGTNIDDFGDAHDKNTGFCNVIRKANVVGKIEDLKLLLLKLLNNKLTVNSYFIRGITI